MSSIFLSWIVFVNYWFLETLVLCLKTPFQGIARMSRWTAYLIGLRLLDRLQRTLLRDRYLSRDLDLLRNNIQKFQIILFLRGTMWLQMVIQRHAVTHVDTESYFQIKLLATAQAVHQIISIPFFSIRFNCSKLRSIYLRPTKVSDPISLNSLTIDFQHNQTAVSISVTQQLVFEWSTYVLERPRSFEGPGQSREK